MLKRLYVNNFKCLVNFELTVDSLNLFLGSNGAGKTTVFEVLRKLQIFILGEQALKGDYRVSALFKSQDLTRWQKSVLQKFELDIEGNGGLYKYTLEIQHQGEYAPPRMYLEILTFGRDNEAVRVRRITDTAEECLSVAKLIELANLT